MKHKHTYLVLIAFAIVTLACFTTCKKYDENYLWFKNPEKLTPFEGNLVGYYIDGADSLLTLPNYFGSEMQKPYNVHPIQFIDYIKRRTHFSLITVGSNPIEFKYEYYDRKKKMRITSFYKERDTVYIKKNILLSDNLIWDIIRINRKGKFKIKTKFNNKIYEIHIEK